MKSLRGLFHGRVIRRGNRITYSDKRSRRAHRVNCFAKTFYSKLLGKFFRVWVSMKAVRTMRKYGGFDNYILLTKPKNMFSLYGEYLRRVMIEKLNDDGLDMRHLTVYGSTPRVRFKRTLRGRVPGIYHPALYRHMDLHPLTIGDERTWTREEMATLKAYSGIFEEYNALDWPRPPKEEEEYVPEPELLKESRHEMETRQNKYLLRMYKTQLINTAKKGMSFEDLGSAVSKEEVVESPVREEEAEPEAKEKGKKDKKKKDKKK